MLTNAKRADAYVRMRQETEAVKEGGMHGLFQPDSPVKLCSDSYHSPTTMRSDSYDSHTTRHKLALTNLDRILT